MARLLRVTAAAAVAAVAIGLAAAADADAAPCDDERYPCPVRMPAPEPAAVEPAPAASPPLPLTQARTSGRKAARKPARLPKVVPLPPERREAAGAGADVARPARDASPSTGRVNTIGAAADGVAVVTPEALNEIDLAADTVQVVGANELSILDAALTPLAALARTETIGAGVREGDGERRGEGASAQTPPAPAAFTLQRALLLFGGVFAAVSAASAMLLFR
jgi:hypothetical protein